MGLHALYSTLHMPCRPADFPAPSVRPHQNARILSCRDQRTSTGKLWRRQLRGRRLRRLTSGRSLRRLQLLLLRQQKSACAPLTVHSAQHASCHCPMIRQIACPCVVHMAAGLQKEDIAQLTMLGKVAYPFLVGCPDFVCMEACHQTSDRECLTLCS